MRLLIEHGAIQDHTGVKYHAADGRRASLASNQDRASEEQVSKPSNYWWRKRARTSTPSMTWAKQLCMQRLSRRKQVVQYLYDKGAKLDVVA